MKNQKLSLIVSSIALLFVFFAAFPVTPEAAPGAFFTGAAVFDLPQNGEDPTPAPDLYEGDMPPTPAPDLPSEADGLQVTAPDLYGGDSADMPMQNAPNPHGASSVEQMQPETGRSAAEMTVAVVVTLLVAGATVFGIVVIKPKEA